MENRIVLEYEDIRKQLASLKVNKLEGFDISSAIAIQIWKSLTYTKLELIKRIFGLLLAEKLEVIDEMDINSVFTTLHYMEPVPIRQDNMQIIDNAISFMEPCNHCKIILTTKLSIKYFLKKIPIFCESFQKLNSYNLLKRTYYSASVAAVWEAIEKISNSSIAKETRCLLTFQDHEMLQNIFVQYIQKNGGQAVCLQHGQRVYRKQDADYMAFDNFISDYTLLWNEFSRIQYEKAGYAHTRLPVVGSTKYANQNESLFVSKNIENRSQIFKRNTIGIILNAPTQFKSKEMNNQMIEWGMNFASKNGYSVLIKLHPTDVETKYAMYCSKGAALVDPEMSMEKFASMISLGIGHASGALVDLIIMNIPIFLYSNEISFPLELPDDVKFSSYDEMNIKILSGMKRFASGTDDFDKIRKMYCVNDASKRHAEFFRKLRCAYEKP